LKPCISVGVTLELWRDFRQVALAAIDAGFYANAACSFWSPGNMIHGLEKLDISNDSTYPLYALNMQRSSQRLPSKA
jgi:hypothetical protein